MVSSSSSIKPMKPNLSARADGWSSRNTPNKRPAPRFNNVLNGDMIYKERRNS